VKKGKRQLIEGQLNRFVMLDDEGPQDMYNWLKKLVNKVQAYGSRRWGGRRVIGRMLRGYAVKDTMVISLIQQYTTFRKMSADDVFGKIINHEMLVEEANHVKNLSKGITYSRKQDFALNASKKSKKKQIVIESSNEEEEEEDEDKEYDEDEMALFIKKFNKCISKRRSFKGDRKEKTRSKKVCYNCGKNGHFIAQCPYERKDEYNDKKKRSSRATRRTRNSQIRSLMDKLMLVKNETQVMRVPSQKVMTWQP
jgi:hypothetical protein